MVAPGVNVSKQQKVHTTTSNMNKYILMILLLAGLSAILVAASGNQDLATSIEASKVDSAYSTSMITHEEMKSQAEEKSLLGKTATKTHYNNNKVKVASSSLSPGQITRIGPQSTSVQDQAKKTSRTSTSNDVKSKDSRTQKTATKNNNVIRKKQQEPRRKPSSPALAAKLVDRTKEPKFIRPSYEYDGNSQLVFVNFAGRLISNDNQQAPGNNVSRLVTNNERLIKAEGQILCGETNRNGKPSLQQNHATGSVDYLDGLQNRIVGGTKAEPGEFTYQVRLNIRSRRGSSLCGAVIIDKRHILTAAHCVTTW